METEQRSFRWGHEALHVEFALGDDGRVRLTHLGLPEEAGNGTRGSLPLVEVTATGHGRDWSGSRLVQTAIGGRLRHRTHRAAGLALHTSATTYLTVWRRPGGEATTTLRPAEQAGGAAGVEVLYPAARQAVAVWNPDAADLTVTLPTAPSAALLRITRTEPDAP
ncbi:hypothetical protein ACFWIO_00720 [Streptomyces diastatochromogenes]|uniref:hypothetical protein n=1 Tax=Streptomyces diastatochromogenes TaxID=42236 RepID=UPI0036689DC6